MAAEKRAEAMRLHRAGKIHQANRQHALALQQYEQAVQAWDHPVIRYDMAVALINLARPLAAHESLKRALRFGAAPFEAAQHRQAKTYLKLVRGRLSRLRVTCRLPGARVSLDGQRLFTAPGQAERLLLSGKHVVVAQRKGHVTQAETLDLAPGSERVIDLSPLPLGASVKRVRRWKRWLPWTVFAAGVAVAAAGIPLVLVSRSDYDQYDEEYADLCPEGCAAGEVPEHLSSLRTKAERERYSAYAMFAIGGATIVSGVVLALLNLPRTVSREPESAEAPVTVVPAPIKGGGLVVSRFRF